MRRLLVLILLVVLLAVADVAVKTYAEDEIERRAQLGTGGSATVNASIDAFPFVPPLLASGKAGDVKVTVEGMRLGDLRIAVATLSLDRVRVDQNRLRESREVRLTDVAGAGIVVEIRVSDLARATGAPLVAEDGEVRVEVAGRSVPVTPRVTTEGSLELRGAPQGVPVPGLRRLGLAGCGDGDTRVEGDSIVVTCRTDDLPPMLLGAAANAPG